MQSYPSQKERDSGVIPVLRHGSEWEADPAQGSTRPTERLSEGLHRGGASMAEHLRAIHSKKMLEPENTVLTLYKKQEVRP